MQLILGRILTLGSGSDLLEGPYRILHIDVDTDTVWCIELPRTRENGRAVGYVKAPIALHISEVSRALDAGQLTQPTFHTPGHWAMTDEDYKSSAELLPRELARRCARLAKRDAAWAIIKPIVGAHTLTDLLDGETVRVLVDQRARECDRSRVTVLRTLHLYWAQGSVMNGLIPATHRCGAPGTERRQVKPIGRRPRRATMPAGERERFIPTEIDKTRMGVAYAMVGPTCPVSVALDRMNRTFYADLEVDEHGQQYAELYPEGRRPSRSQFCYWGERRSESQKFRKENRLPTIIVKRTHRGGSTSELASAIGQCAQFDGTSTDTYLTSLFDRRTKLTPPTRTIIAEQLTGIILAPFIGWEHPGASTTLQAIYMGATDKAEICARFGIDIKLGQWPGVLCRKYLMDGGEGRNQEVITVSEQFGFGVEYAPSYAGAAKGDVETCHHADHKTLDHRTPGTTLGHQRKRGEKHPADAALWNYFEYMQEYLRRGLDILQAEVEALAPTRLLASGIRPTRINIFNWYRDRGQTAEIVCDLDQLRAMTLPEVDAVIQYNGIVVKYPGTNNRVEGPRFFCEALRNDARFVTAVETRKVVQVRVRLDPQSLREVWLPTTTGLLRVINVSSDAFLIQHGTFADLAQHRESEADYKAQHTQAQNQAEVEKTMRRDATTAAAQAELKRQSATAPVKVTKAEQRKNLRGNAAAEQQEIEEQGLTLTRSTLQRPPNPSSSANSSAASADNASAQAVAALVRSLSNTATADEPN